MGSIKKRLDKFDLGTPLIADILGGTADYGEGAEEEEKDLKAAQARDVLSTTRAHQGTKRRSARKSNMLT